MRKSEKYPNEPRPLRWAAFLWLVALGGCVAGSAGGTIARSAEGPAFESALGLHQRGESLKSLALRGLAALTSDEGRHVFRFEALALKPDYFLFTAFDPAGRPAFRLAAAEGRLTALSAGDRRYAAGPATPENFARFVPLGLTQDRLLALLSGSTPRPAEAGARPAGDNTELLIVPEGAGDEEIWRLRLAGGLDQDPRRIMVLSAVRGRPGRPDLTIRYLSSEDTPREDAEGFKEPFPRSVEAEWRADGGKQSLRLSYQEARLGLPLTAADFVLKRPEGFETVELAGGAAWPGEDRLE